MPQKRSSEPVTYYKTLEATVKATGAMQKVRLTPDESGPLDEPKSLTKALMVVLVALCFITLTMVTLLFLSGFNVGGFELHHSVLVALVGGLSLEFVAAIISPLVRGISHVYVEQIRAGRS